MTDSLATRLAQMRADFDQSFAAAPIAAAAGQDHLLAIRIGDEGYAIRVAAIRAIAHVGRIVHLPSSLPELLGIAGLRGELTPLYDLGALLGYPAAPAAPRWFVQVGRDDTVGLAFEHFEGYRLTEIDPGNTAGTDPAAAAGADRAASPTGKNLRPHVAAVVRLEGEVRSLIDINSLLNSLQSRVQAVRTEKE
ncbi:MAG TPA: chemotaxis protein CheW [Planctomycetota bacterium]|nr:chemotaxis protein CheW [Planctomycetota bacterium]